MKVFDVKQGSMEWLSLRAGIPTASQFDQIITPKTGKPSASQPRYMHALIAERLMGQPLIEHVSFYMERGSRLESEAVRYYEFQRDVETVPVGFVTNDEETVGASPDRLVGEDGLLEIKCPAAHTHVAYLLYKPVDRAYWPQVQGQLWITGRRWLDMLSYHPGMPEALVRVERDEEYIGLLSAAVLEFSTALEAQHRELVERIGPGEEKPRPVPITDMMRDALLDVASGW